MHAISVNTSALPHCQVGDKKRSDNRDFVIVEFPTRVNVYVLKLDCDKIVWETHSYSSVNENIAQIAVELQHNDSSATVCSCIDYINCTAVDGYKKCTKVMIVATQFVLKWCYSGTVR